MAAVTLGACVLAIVPLVAHGDEVDAPIVSSEVAAALEVRDEINELNAAAVEEAPPAVGDECRRTLEVEGIGDTCVTEDGLLRVEQADGRSHTTHGMDAPPIGSAASYWSRASLDAISGASVADVSCVDAPAPRYVLVYARPSDVASRFSSIGAKLRQEAYKLSAFIDAEAQAITPGASRRLPVDCTGGVPTVLNLELTGLRGGNATFGQIVDGLRAHGLEFNGDGTNSQRYIVYFDAPSPTGAAGTGHVFASDASSGAGNANNTGGLYAVEYRFANGGSVPHWDVLVHEVLHTMGAVVTAAPNNSGVSSNGAGAGHCIDGLDVMCYDDRGSRGASYNPNVCTVKVIDCNRDDYFHPSPPAGSYLATHWNVAATYNRFLLHQGAVRTPRAAAPTITQLRQTGTSRSAVGVTWRGTGASEYVVSVRRPNGSWRDAVTTPMQTATVPGLAAGHSYEIGVMPVGASDRVTLTVRTSTARDVRKPTRPGVVRVRRTASTLVLRWAASRDDVGVRRYELRQISNANGRGKRRTPRVVARSVGTSVVVRTRSFRTGVTHRFQLVAVDAAGNRSVARALNVKLPKDRTKPTRPGRLRTIARTSSSVTLTWSESRDASGIARYVVQQRVGSRWVALGARLNASQRSLRVTGLTAGSVHAFRVLARDRAGNVSAASATLRARTR